MTDTTEFVQNPSNLSKHLVKIVLKLDKKYQDELKKRSFIKKLVNDVKLEYYCKQGHIEFYNFLKTYTVPKTKSINKLFSEFEKVYDKLIFHNHALGYFYVRNKPVSNPVITKEDEKNILLKKLFEKKITVKEFNKLFGHYALNPYELSSKRFEKYTLKEIMKLAKLASNYETNKTFKLNDYIVSNKKKVFPILVSLREYAKYNILFIIKELRYLLLDIEKEKQISNIFDLSYKELQEKLQA